MNLETLIQGELDACKLGERVVLGFRSDRIVTVLNWIARGNPTEEKHLKTFKQANKFLSEMVCDVRRGGFLYRDIQLAMKRFRWQKGEPVSPFSVQDPNETLDFLSQFRQTISKVQRGEEVENEKISDVLGFFVVFSQGQL